MFNQLFEKSKYSSLLLIKNGFYIPLIGYALFFYTNNIFLTSIITMKLFPTNFFFWFHHNMKYFPEPYIKYNQLKQFIRFTDSGYLASFIYYFYPEFLPVAFNIHSIICIGYWYGKFVLKMSDADLVSDPEYIYWYNNLWTSMNHGWANVLLIRELYINESESESEICHNYFTLNDLLYSYWWVYCWFFLIYLPWRCLTNDCVYDIFGDKYSLSSKLQFIGIIHLIVLASNNIGYLLTCAASN